MNPTTDTDPYYLVLDTPLNQVIYVFLAHDPAGDGSGGPLGEPVSLELLPNQFRFGMIDGLPTGRPLLGQHPSGALRFREFPSASGLQAAGYVLIPNFRICDTWDDYHSPWDGVFADQTVSAGGDESA
jgi:hypothetical protein